MTDNSKTTIGLLSTLLTLNILLKITNNIYWSWPLVLWPVGVSLIVFIIGVFLHNEE